MLIKIRPSWEIPEREVTPHQAWLDRRRFIQAAGASILGGSGCGLAVHGDLFAQLDGTTSPYAHLFPVPPNDAYEVPERPLTDPLSATQYNNFYEFTTSKSSVYQLVGGFEIEPWTVQIEGLVRNPGIFDVEDLMTRFDMEERIYRFRCVETWAMTVPWSGFPLSKLVEFADPLPEATHVAMISASRPDQMPGVASNPGYPWPYFEGLRLDEATHELAMMVGGIYGQALPRQNGAPLRLIVPWKYGYKSIKSVVRIAFVDGEPGTFWNTLVPSEYDFLSNVDPDVPHPRWSQAEEWLIPNSGDKVPTQKYNGYADLVQPLYL